MIELEQLKPTLMALTDVEAPDIPIDIDFQEIQDLLHYIGTHPEAAAALAEVGLAPTVIEIIRTALPAARRAQSVWNALRNPRKPEDHKDFEDKGRGLRADTVAGVRLTLKGNLTVQSSIDRIVDGEGIADLAQDLDDLAALLAKHLEALAPNRKLDAPRRIPQLQTAASDIRLGLAEFRTDDAQKDAVDLRNRAWTWLETHVNELRDAARYAFLGTATAKEFRSAYERRRRQRRKSKGGGEGPGGSSGGSVA